MPQKNVYFLMLFSMSACGAFAQEAMQGLNVNHIRTLSASCAACHGTNGNAVGGNVILAGMNAQIFEKKMLQFKSGALKATVMHHHAKGLLNEEISGLAQYFSAQKPQIPALLKPAEVQ